MLTKLEEGTLFLKKRRRRKLSATRDTKNGTRLTRKGNQFAAKQKSYNIENKSPREFRTKDPQSVDGAADHPFQGKSFHHSKNISFCVDCHLH